MRYDFETQAAQVVADYLSTGLDPAITNISPVVTFFDPMSIDQSNRIVVMCPNGSTLAEQPGNAEMQVEVGVKSRWLQATIAADFAAHFTRLNAVRALLFRRDAEFQSQLKAPHGIGVNAILNKREFSTQVYKEGWIYSETTLRVEMFAR